MSRPFATGRLFIRGVKRAEWDVDKATLFEIRSIFVGMLRDFPELPEAPHMLEIEFHGFPESERFTRFGSDTSMRAAPYEIKDGRFN